MPRTDEAFLSTLPRSETLEGDDLTLAEIRPDGTVVVTDGTRAAVYGPHETEPLAGPGIRIVPRYVEAGWFTEVAVVHLTDGTRQAVYAPVEIMDGHHGEG